MNYFKTAMFLSLALGIAACGAKNTKQAQQAATNAVKANGNPVAETATYVSDCTNSILPDIGAIKFLGTRTVYELSLLNFTKKKFYYTDVKCTNEAVVVQETGTLNYNGTAQKDQPAQVDFEFKETLVKVQSPELANLFGTFGICDIKTWTPGADTKVTSAATEKTCPGDPAPRTAQELLLVQNGALFLGDDTKQTQRPDHVDMTKAFVKQP